MPYELVIVPPKMTTQENSHCTMCGYPLELIDEFINVKDMPEKNTDYEGFFSICPECSTPHLELLSGEIDFKGPVLIGWE